MKKNTKGYRFIDRTKAGRKIEVIFDHMPGKRISTGATNMTDAVLFAERFLENDGFTNDTVPLFGEFAKDFYLRTDPSSYHGRQISFKRANRDAWYIETQRFVDNYLIPRFGRYKLDSITPVVVEEWIASFEGKGVSDLSGATRLKVLKALRYIMDDAVRLGHIQSNPARKIMTPSPERQEDIRVLTIWEQNVLFPSDPEKRIQIWGSAMWATYFSVMYDTGFRPNEVEGLQLGDVYRTPGGLAVYTGHSMNSEERNPKAKVKTSGKGMEKRVGLLSEATADLMMHFISVDNIVDADEFLFLVDRSRKDSYIFNDTSNKHFKSVCSRYGVEGVSQYCLRHTYTTNRRGNMDDKVLAITMGHANGVRSDYDHRDAAIVISQLERSRGDLFKAPEVPDIVPLGEKAN